MREKPEILGREIIASSRLFKIEQIELRFQNGEKRTYERLCSTGYGSVMVVPMLDDDQVLLIREYAAGVDHYELGLPKGLIEGEEDIYKAANRELQEEVGYAAKQMDTITTFSAAPGYLSSSMSLILAKDLYESRLPGDEPEEIEVVPWRLSQIHELIKRDDVTEARTIAALFMVREILHGH